MNAPSPLPRLRRNRRFDVPGLIGRFSTAVADVDGQVEPYAQRWDQANHQALTETGPLWVVLGDSSSQGIGASTWEAGWVHDARSRLDAASGDRWRIVNLSMSGGRFLDVVDRQLPVLESALPAPDLVTCVIGGNDLMWRRGKEPIYRDARVTVKALPSHTVLSRVGGNTERRRRVNEILESDPEASGHRLFSIWSWPSARGALAQDRVHPSDLGYRYMADLAWPAIAAQLGLPAERLEG